MKKVGGLLLLAVWLMALGWSHNRMAEQLRDKNAVRTEIVLPPMAQLDPRVVNILTMGHRGVYDDFIHLWFNYYLVDEEHLKRHPKDAIKIGDILLRQRPMIETSYVLMCFVFVNDIRRPELCEPIIQTGMRIFPMSFILPMAQGYVFLKPLNEPTRAAAYYAMAAQTENAPPHVIRIAEKLIKKETLSPEELLDVTESFDNLLGKKAFEALLKKKYGDTIP